LRYGDGAAPGLDELFKTADAAMYEAKRAGGNRVAVAVQPSAAG
jgi:GGDEF domain-containing protein